MFTIEPRPAATRCTSAARVNHIGAVRLTVRMFCHASVVTSPTGPSPPSPPAALFTRTVRPPSVSAARATSSSHACSSRSSAVMKCARPPSASIDATAASPRDVSRPVTHTAAPSAAKRHAIARPMPDVDPVMSARSPASRTPYLPKSRPPKSVGGYRRAELLRRGSSDGSPGSSVSTSMPDAVVSRVCSNCAVSEPSAVTAVQPSGQMRPTW